MSLRLLLLLIACLQSVTAVQWIPDTQAVDTTQVCFGNSITVGWNYSLTHGETVEDIKWLFTPNNSHTPEIVASYVYGFFNPVPAYANRLNHLGDGFVVLAGVTSADAGTYIVDIISRKSGSFSTDRRNLVVTVADPAVYSSTALTMKMAERAVPGADGDLHIQLTCGPLAWRGEPPADLIWNTPSGPRVSSGYENGSFYLTLDAPIQSGNYSCGLGGSGMAALCLAPGDPLTTPASLAVDAVAARLTLLEAKETGHRGDVVRLTQQLQQVRGELDQYRDKSSSNVGFHAKLNSDVKMYYGNPIKFKLILYNEGGAYDGRTGVYTAPRDGTYFFAFTVSSYDPGLYRAGRLVADGLELARANSKNADYVNPATGHAVVHLAKGARVWVESWGNNAEYYELSVFSGFLVHPGD